MQTQLILAEDTIKEMRGVLKGKKFRYPTEIMDLIIQELEALAEIFKRASQADFIVSGDMHLLEIEDFKETKILTPEEFLNTFD